jgi:anaerobic magnesium-protoporphyrin IX monomethyl ester cyclase
MRVLLLSMPNSSEHLPVGAVRLPNGALSSIAGNVDANHKVAVADLILVQASVRETICKLMAQWDPDLVGLSIMTFQRPTALEIIKLVRLLKPGVLIAVGGYDPSLASEVYTDPSNTCADFVVRGEGEITFRDLVRAIESKSGYEHIAGLSFRADSGFRHNPNRAISKLDEIKPPNRAARVLSGYTMLGRQVDVVETSRGCTFDCSFCSIIEMRGRNFYKYSLDRVITDIRDACAHGARHVFLVDDNITLDVRRFTALCQAIIDAGLNTIDYSVQAMTATIANHGETLAPLMRRAGFRYVFLGIENILDQDLAFLKAASKNARRVNGRRTGNAAIDAIQHLHRNGMLVVGGLIVGNPEDTREDIEANLEFARRWVDWPYIQHPTPYPRTPMTLDLRDRDLINNADISQYDGTTSVIACKHLTGREIEFMRWKAERWMKVRHVPAMMRHDPLFMLWHLRRVFVFTFRGSSVRSMLGLEDEHKVFERYCMIRRAERHYSNFLWKEPTAPIHLPPGAPTWRYDDAIRVAR